MSDGNEKALSAVTLKAKWKRRERTTQPYHACNGTATTARREPSLDGRSLHADLESRPVVTDPRHRSHSATLIAIAAGIAARMVR
jgi:hypothetical protein